MFDWDAIIVGGGPTGLTAGLYLSRGRIRTLLIEEEGFGGKVKNLEWVENYPGFSKGLAGPQLASEMHSQASNYGLQSEFSKVTALELYSSSKCVIVDGGTSYTTSVVILAGGSRPRKLGVPGEEEYLGRGVFTCAFCDGEQFVDKVVAVCGGGDAGVTEALYMTRLASKVILLETLPQLTASAILQERAYSNQKLDIRCGLTVTAITGDNQVKAILCNETKTGQTITLEVDGILVYIGMTPATEYLPASVRLDKNNQIIVNEKMETEVPYVLAAGDIRSGSGGQISTAVGDGAMAATTAIRLLQEA